jgi:3-oxoacyl-[acyl-carrier-protein] synthase III
MIILGFGPQDYDLLILTTTNLDQPRYLVLIIGDLGCSRKLAPLSLQLKH